METAERDYDVYECRSCGNLGVAESTPTCCEESMEVVDVAVPVESPDLEAVVREVFDMSPTELDICRRLMAAEEATVDDLTSELDRDRSVISRHINHLAELGVVEKESEVLADGGRKFVYSPSSLETIQRQLVLGLHAWQADAMEAVDQLSREKIETMSGPRTREQEAGSSVQSLLDKVFGWSRSS